MSFEKIRRGGTVALLAVLAAANAAAEPRPLLVPNRDVTVDYQVAPSGHASIGVRVAIRAGGTKLRITSDTLPTTLLVNRDTEQAAIMLPMLRAYSDVKIGRYDPEHTVLKDASFLRTGRDRVAGHECTVWRSTSKDGTAEACITPDGLILRGAVDSDKRGRQVTVDATRVDFGPIAEAEFEVPPDFQKSPFKLSLDGFGK
jgi:hypothetical protein